MATFKSEFYRNKNISCYTYVNFEHVKETFAPTGDLIFLSSQWRVEEEKRADHEDKGQHSAANRR